MFKRMIIALGVVLCLTTQCFAAWWDSTTINLQIKTVSAAFTDVQNCLLALDGTSGDPPTNIVAKNLKLNGTTSGVLTIKPPATATTGTLTIDNRGTNTLTVPNANSVTLPSGALFYMITGSCPAGTTDVTATYSNKFVRINATGGSTGGADTHTQGVGSYTISGNTGGSDGTGAGSNQGTVTGGGPDYQGHLHAVSIAVTGTSAAGDNVPAYVTAKACTVD